jgi:hypothetical protein
VTKTLPPILNAKLHQEEQPLRKRQAIIWDLDGTLNLSQPQARFNWKDTAHCNEVMANAKANWPMISLLNALYNQVGAKPGSAGVAFLLCTGRPEAYKSITTAWLKTHKAKIDHVIMRPDEDDRPDAEVKRDMLRSIQDEFEVWFVVEDRACVTKMWRDEGLMCLQCAEGNY